MWIFLLLQSQMLHFQVMRSRFITKKIEPGFKNLRKKLQFIFLKLDDKNNNIYHIIKDNKDNIIYTNRSKKDILNDFIDNFTKNDYEIIVKKETKESQPEASQNLKFPLPSLSSLK